MCHPSNDWNQRGFWARAVSMNPTLRSGHCMHELEDYSKYKCWTFLFCFILVLLIIAGGSCLTWLISLCDVPDF